MASVSLEQDAGYWEVLVLETPGGSLSIGVSPRRDRQFFNKAEKKDDAGVLFVKLRNEPTLTTISTPEKTTARTNLTVMVLN